MALPTTHRVYTLEELSQLPDQGPNWLVPNVIEVAGKAILYGHGGIGKTNVVMDLAVSVASGTPFLGLVPPTKTGPVLLCSTESSLRANKSRLLWLANAHDTPTSIPLYYMHEAIYLDDPTDRVEFWNILNGIRPVLLILDPLDSFFWGDEDKAYTTKPVRSFLDAVTRSFECAVFALTHAAAKEDPEAAIKKPRGSTAWFGWADTVIQARKDRRRSGRAGLVLEATKQRNEDAGELIRITPRVMPEQSLILFDPELPAGHAETPANLGGKVLEVLGAGETLTLTALRERVGGRAATVRAALDELTRVGQVVALTLDVPAGAGRPPRRAAAWRIANGAPGGPAPGYAAAPLVPAPLPARLAPPPPAV